jgi:hypothetical protein
MNRPIDLIALVVSSGHGIAVEKFSCPSGHLFVEVGTLGKGFSARCPWCDAKGTGASEIPSMVTHDRVQAILQNLGVCGKTDDAISKACVLPVSHEGRHGFEPPPQCPFAHPEGPRCNLSEHHLGAHRAEGNGYSYTWHFVP